LLPRDWRRALASVRQRTEPSLRSECNRFDDRRAVPKSNSGLDGAGNGSDEGMDVVTGAGYKVIVGIAVGIVDIGGDNRGSRIRIRRDEGTELGSSMMRVELIVNLFPDKFYRRMSAPLRSNVSLCTYLQGHLRG